MRRAVAVIVLAATVLAGCSTGSRPTTPAVPSDLAGRPRASSEAATLFPAASERDLPGDPTWAQAYTAAQHDIEGFTDRDSALPGAPVRLLVSTRFPRFRVQHSGWAGTAEPRPAGSG